MLNAANLPTDLRSGVWAEAAKTACVIENSLVSATKTVPSYKKFYQKEVLSIKTLHPFGELAVVEINSNRKVRKKLENRGRICMYL
jgi:hypothetical protein